MEITFFFCFPPPDLAGFEDGGGALSFFGACERQNRKEIKRKGNQKKKIKKDAVGVAICKLPSLAVSSSTRVSGFEASGGREAAASGRELEPRAIPTIKEEVAIDDESTSHEHVITPLKKHCHDG